MTTIEVAKEIKSKGTQFYGIMPASTYYATLSRIINGTAKTATIIKFFNTFGYTFKEELTWEKKF